MLVRSGMLVNTANTAPGISNFTLTSGSKAAGCAVITMTATWNIDRPNNTLYKLRIQQTGAEFACASTAGTSVSTAQTYSDGVTNLTRPTLTLQVLLRSNNSVVTSVSAQLDVAVETGGTC